MYREWKCIDIFPVPIVIYARKKFRFAYEFYKTLSDARKIMVSQSNQYSFELH
jgi:hypothetical protein